MSWQQLVKAVEAVRAAAGAAQPALRDLRLAGIGWATVDAERAQQELDARLGPVDDPAGTWVLTPRDAALGARAWLRVPSATSPGETALVLLEPDTEGRIAASLARFGEGVAVIYLGDGSPGAGRLLHSDGMWGPHVVLVGGSDA